MTADGRVVGEHAGVHHFTVGQRRGLGVAAGEPLYVLATDPESNLVVAGPREELAAQRVELAPAVLHRGSERIGAVKLRYRSAPVECRVAATGPGTHERLELELAEHAYGVAAGQTACLMDGDRVVGHGTIAAAVGAPALPAAS